MDICVCFLRNYRYVVWNIFRLVIIKPELKATIMFFRKGIWVSMWYAEILEILFHSYVNVSSQNSGHTNVV